MDFSMPSMHVQNIATLTWEVPMHGWNPIHPDSQYKEQYVGDLAFALSLGV